MSDQRVTWFPDICRCAFTFTQRPDGTVVEVHAFTACPGHTAIGDPEATLTLVVNEQRADSTVRTVVADALVEYRALSDAAILRDRIRVQWLGSGAQRSCQVRCDVVLTDARRTAVQRALDHVLGAGRARVE